MPSHCSLLGFPPPFCCGLMEAVHFQQILRKPNKKKNQGKPVKKWSKNTKPKDQKQQLAFQTLTEIKLWILWRWIFLQIQLIGSIWRFQSTWLWEMISESSWWLSQAKNNDEIRTHLPHYSPCQCFVQSSPIVLEKKNHVSSVSSTWTKKKAPLFFGSGGPIHTIPPSKTSRSDGFVVFFSVGGRFQTSKLHCFWLVVQPHRPQKGEVDLPTCDSWTQMTPPGFPNIFLAGKSPNLIGDTASNGCFSIVMLAFGGCNQNASESQWTKETGVR